MTQPAQWPRAAAQEQHAPLAQGHQQGLEVQRRPEPLALLDERGIAHSFTGAPALMGLFGPRGSSPGGEMLNPDRLTALLAQLDNLAKRAGSDGRGVPLITPPGLRVGVRGLIEPVLPSIPVLSLAELPANVNLRTIATWELDDAA